MAMTVRSCSAYRRCLNEQGQHAGADRTAYASLRGRRWHVPSLIVVKSVQQLSGQGHTGGLGRAGAH